MDKVNFVYLFFFDSINTFCNQAKTLPATVFCFDYINENMCPTSQIVIRQMLGLADGNMNLALESIPPHLPMCLCHSQHCGSLEDCGYPAVLMKHIVTSLPRHR